MNTSDLSKNDKLTKTEQGAERAQELVELGAVTETKGAWFGGKPDVGNGVQLW